MENMTKDFEEFLCDRLQDIPGTGDLEKWSKEEQKFVGRLELEQELVDAGVNKDKANELYNLVYVGIGDLTEKAYTQGVKDGCQLMLHLLGKAPENKKDVS